MNSSNFLRLAVAQMILAMHLEQSGDAEQARIHRDNSALYVRRAAVEAEKKERQSVRCRSQRT